jgi:dolichyl-phosphate beta-glucosyltransferase
MDRRTDPLPVSPHFKPNGQVAVILPTYNEQAHIQKTFEALLRYIPDHPNYTFIFVNDGSGDRTKQILTTGIQIAKTNQIKLLSYSPRAGKGYAIRRGVEFANSDIICYLDSDLAYSLEHLESLVKKLQYCDVVLGCRGLAVGTRKASQFNHQAAEKLIHFLSRNFLNLRYSDMQTGLKGFRREAAKKLFSAQTLTGSSFDIELIYLAKKWGFAIGEIPACLSDRHQRKVSPSNRVQDSIRMLIDLLKIRLNDRMGLYR